MNTASQRRFGAVTPSQSAELDAAAVDLGIEVAQLMEVAGLQVARLAWRMVGGRPAALHVVAGHGNNGGDALVAARHLAAWGCTVSVSVVRRPDALGDERARQCLAARGAGAHVVVSDRATDAVAPDAAALTLDGLLGTGLAQAPRPQHAAAIEAMRAPVLSIDVPSGFDALTGVAPGAGVTATVTCALAACKRGLWVAGATRWTGVVHVADIGIPATAWERCDLPAPTAVRGGSIRRVRALERVRGFLTELPLACMLAISACSLARQRHDQRRSTHRTNRCE